MGYISSTQKRAICNDIQMTPVISNIEKRMREKGLTQKGLALKAGLNETAVRDILQGRSKDPQLSTLRALAEVLQCSIEDLYRNTAKTGYGLADRPAAFTWPENIGRDTTEVVPSTAVETALEMSVIAEVKIPFAAAAPADKKQRHVRRQWTVPEELLQGRTAADVVIIEVQGDSMAPDFMPGDRAVVDTADTVPSPAGVFLIWDGTGLFLRQCDIRPQTKPATITLTPRNPRYNTHDLHLKNITVHGRVIGKWQRV